MTSQKDLATDKRLLKRLCKEARKCVHIKYDNGWEKYGHYIEVCPRLKRGKPCAKCEQGFELIRPLVEVLPDGRIRKDRNHFYHHYHRDKHSAVFIKKEVINKLRAMIEVLDA